MNQDAIEFLERNGVRDVDKLVGTGLLPSKGINKIVSEYGFFRDIGERYVSIVDVLGYDYPMRHHNIFRTMEDFFDSKGDGYHTRSVSMLKYTSDEIVGKLGDSFKKEPLVVREIDPDKYIISNNGMHRFTVLRMHYLIEYNKFKYSPEELKRLKEKYMIPMEVSTVDYVKTYCNYLLSRIPDQNFGMIDDYDVNNHYRPTGLVSIKNELGERVQYNNSQLIDFVRSKVLSDENKDYFTVVPYFCERYETFNQFVDQFIPELKYNKKDNEEGRTR